MPIVLMRCQGLGKAVRETTGRSSWDTTGFAFGLDASVLGLHRFGGSILCLTSALHLGTAQRNGIPSAVTRRWLMRSVQFHGLAAGWPVCRCWLYTGISALAS